MGTRIVGIDAGGTRTSFVVADEQGRILSQGIGGSGNQNVVGLDILRQSVYEAAPHPGYSLLSYFVSFRLSLSQESLKSLLLPSFK
jgi:N-acetylglucosamine kinase-like BadF-type ATPase